MAPRLVFLFKKAQSRFGSKGFTGTRQPDFTRCLRELCGKDVPIGSQFKRTAQLGQQRESPMAVNAAFKLGRFWPRVRVEHPVRAELNVCLSQTAPKRLRLGTQ